VRYIIFVVDGSSSSASGDEMSAIDAFNDALRRDGQWVMAAGIAAPTSATLIDNRHGAGVERHGSLFEEAEYYSGFWIIEASSSDEALRLAWDGSRACNRRVELRPFLR
jgi:hypothetical protein